MVRSSHHLPLPSLPPPRVVLPPSPRPPLPPRKFEEVLDSGAAVSPHRIYREDPQRKRERGRERTYQYVNESPTGTPSLAPSLPSWYISMLYRRTDISHAGHTFFRSPILVRLLSSDATPDEPRAPSRHSNYEFDTDRRSPPCLPFSGTYVLSPS